MKTENEAYFYSSIYPEAYRQKSRKPEPLHVKKVIKFNPDADDPLNFFGYCLIDHCGKQFSCIHEQCREFCSCYKTENDPGNRDFHALRYHADDRLILYQEVLPDIQKYIGSIPVHDLPEYRLSFNHRYIHKDGCVSQFLHEGTMAFSGEIAHPVLNLSVFSEIGDIKTDDTMVLTIFRYFAEDGYKKVFTKVYGETQDGQLTQREREIIRLCLDGLSSKMIAAKLNLSIHTVKNHKRNSMEKTLTHNIAELINLCIRYRWL